MGIEVRSSICYLEYCDSYNSFTYVVLLDDSRINGDYALRQVFRVEMANLIFQEEY